MRDQASERQNQRDADKLVAECFDSIHERRHESEKVARVQFLGLSGGGVPFQ